MSANCYWCTDTVSKMGAIVNHIGKAHEPIGVCSVCQILACGHHGLRDNGTDTFVCVDCDLYGICQKALGAASAGTVTDPNTPDDATQAARDAVEAVLGRRFRSYNLPWKLKEQPLYTLADLKADRPQYKDWIMDVSPLKVDTFQWKNLSAWNQFSQAGPEKKLVLIAVAVIAQHLYPKGNIPKDLPEIIRELSSHIRTDDDQSFQQMPAGES